MNENPATEPIRPPEIPAEAPGNPYRRSSSAMNAPIGDPSDPRTEGLNGGTLDLLLRSRMAEGIRIGFNDGQRDAQSVYPTIYDEAWRVGKGEGFTEGYGVVLNVVVPELEAAIRRLETIKGATGSLTIKQTCDAGIAEIHAAFKRL